jgi:hypothetical protein
MNASKLQVLSAPDVPVLTEDASEVAHPEEDSSRSVPALKINWARNTTLHFLINFRMGPISVGGLYRQAFPD